MLEAYEHDHFGYDDGARAVAEATLDLMRTLPPNDKLPGRLVRQLAYSLMDDALLDAFRFPHPRPFARYAFRAGLRARGRVVRLLPPREQPLYLRQFPTIRGYPAGYDVERLGTFPVGCPVAPAQAPTSAS